MMQRDTDWDKARVAKITASMMKNVMAVSKRDGKPLQARQDYLGKLVVEMLTGEPQGIPMTAAMQWGVDCEGAARAEYEAKYGVVVQEVGFIPHPDLPYIGASPDGLIGADGGQEIKCPFNSIVHIETITGGMPEEHMPQVQGNIWVTGRKWWDFVSFDPRMPKDLRLYVQRINRDDDYIKQLSKSCDALWIEAQEMVSKLIEKRKAA